MAKFVHRGFMHPGGVSPMKQEDIEVENEETEKNNEIEKTEVENEENNKEEVKVKDSLGAFSWLTDGTITKKFSEIEENMRDSLRTGTKEVIKEAKFGTKTDKVFNWLGDNLQSVSADLTPKIVSAYMKSTGKNEDQVLEEFKAEQEKLNDPTQKLLSFQKEITGIDKEEIESGNYSSLLPWNVAKNFSEYSGNAALEILDSMSVFEFAGLFHPAGDVAEGTRQASKGNWTEAGINYGIAILPGSNAAWKGLAKKVKKAFKGSKAAVQKTDDFFKEMLFGPNMKNTNMSKETIDGMEDLSKQRIDLVTNGTDEAIMTSDLLSDKSKEIIIKHREATRQTISGLGDAGLSASDEYGGVFKTPYEWQVGYKNPVGIFGDSNYMLNNFDEIKNIKGISEGDMMLNLKNTGQPDPTYIADVPTNWGNFGIICEEAIENNIRIPAKQLDENLDVFKDLKLDNIQRVGSNGNQTIYEVTYPGGQKFRFWRSSGGGGKGIEFPENSKYAFLNDPTPGASEGYYGVLPGHMDMSKMPIEAGNSPHWFIKSNGWESGYGNTIIEDTGIWLKQLDETGQLEKLSTDPARNTGNYGATNPISEIIDTQEIL